MRKICVIGSGYVGLVTGTCFADLGNKVVTVDIDERKIKKLHEGIMPIYEPGLEELVERNVKAERLTFTTSYEDGLDGAEFVFICVGTPSAVDGEADLKYVRSAAQTIGQMMDHPLIIVNKSTVPVGTGDWTAEIVRNAQETPIEFSVVSCPEFLREGAAISDFMNPDRNVFGSANEEAAREVAKLYDPLGATAVITDIRTAEMIKYASNAFLATRISFINEISIICERLGADVTEVARGMGFDKRIGPHFLSAGVGYGGSCFTADETIFALNSPNVIADRIEDYFLKADGEPIQGDVITVKVPEDKRVLGFDLETGKSTLSHVQAVTRRPYQGMMVTIKTSMGRQMVVTADHPVILYNPKEFEVVRAIDVAPGDQVMAMMKLPVVEEPLPFNLIDMLEGTDLEADVYLTSDEPVFTEQYDNFKAHITKEWLKYPHDVKRYNRMSLQLYRHLTQLGVLDVPAKKLKLYTAKGAATMVNAIIPVDADLMRLVGYYIAEGYISVEEGRKGAERHRIGITFHEEELEYIEDVQRILSRYGIKFTTRNSTHATTTNISSRVFAWFLRDVLRCGTRSEDAALPYIAFNVSENLRFELLRGLFSGDGAVTTVQDGNNLMLEYATVSKKLADGMTLLLQSIGVVPSIRRRMMNKSTMLAYILRVSGYRQLEQLVNIFGNKRREKIQSVLAGYKRIIKQRGFDSHEDYSILTVTDVEYFPVDTHVYSLETSTETVLTASGLISHNCFPKDVKALANMATTHGMHPQLLNAVMEINDFQRKQISMKVRDLMDGTVEGKVIGILGLAFKPNTDDIREAPALTVARTLINQGAIVRGYDPVAMENVAEEMPGIELVDDPYAVADGADALLILTEWNEFKQLDMNRVKSLLNEPIIVDGRNIYNPDDMRKRGFVYRGVGRGFNGEGLNANGGD